MAFLIIIGTYLTILYTYAVAVLFVLRTAVLDRLLSLF